MSSLEEFAKAIEGDKSSMIEISRDLVDVNVRLPRQNRPPALVHAARFGRKDVVDILLRANARVNVPDERGSTACHVAAQGDHCGVLALLLARQPNLAAVDVNGKTSFCFALRSCHYDDGRCALMLLEAGASLERADPFRLCRFAATSTAAIQALIDRGVVVRELRTFDDGTPLHQAAVNSQDATVFDMLVNVCGIDLEARDEYGFTCVHPAAEWNYVFALRWLLSAGADVNGVDKNGFTPLHKVYDLECTKLLLACEADVGARDKLGRTALHRVARKEVDLNVLHSLLAAGADLDIADDRGETAREALATRGWTIGPDQVDAARREIAKTRLNLVLDRALQVCIGLQSLRLNALQMCEILQFACLGGRVSHLIPFHIWWKIATTVKHLQTVQTK
jgi:ankyrin repeat protein